MHDKEPRADTQTQAMMPADAVRDRVMLAQRLLMAAPLPDGVGGFLLRVEETPGTWHKLTSPTVIGRSSEADVCLDHRGVSSRHCELRCEDEVWLLTDCRSKNGTRVNDERVTEHPLRRGDVVQVGPVVFLFLQVDFDGGG